jgi:hypothetical protein
LLNAVTESIDHEERGSSRRSLSRSADVAKRETRMLSLTDGNGADFKARAFKLAVEMAS